jgi:hypothetical protein
MQTATAAFQHEALLYEGPDGFLAGTVPFIREGLGLGQPVLAVVGAEKMALLREALGDDAEGVRFADMAQIGRNPGRIIPLWHDFLSAAEAQGDGARGVGEPVWSGRTDAELVEAAHEGAGDGVLTDDGDAGGAQLGGGVALGGEVPVERRLQPVLTFGAAVAAAVVHQVPLGAVPIEIGLKSLAGVNRFEIRLDPAELGLDRRDPVADRSHLAAHPLDRGRVVPQPTNLARDLVSAPAQRLDLDQQPPPSLVEPDDLIDRRLLAPPPHRLADQLRLLADKLQAQHGCRS